jgi:hypothetical protein
MTVCNFSQPRHYHESQHDVSTLAAFALGAQHPEIYNVLIQDGTLPSSLATQERLESIAKHYWHESLFDSRLYHTACRHADALVDSRNVLFNDLSLHLEHPELPLIKYYGAIQASKGEVDKDQIWQRHLVYCRTLCLALHELQRHPEAQVCYCASSVTVSSPKEHQCFSYTFQASARCFHLNHWRYFLLPLPWEPANVDKRSHR